MAKPPKEETASAVVHSEKTEPNTNSSQSMSFASEHLSIREASDLPSLFAGMPGVHVKRSGLGDSFASLSIRGSASNQISVYFAGIPLSGGADPTIDLASLPLFSYLGVKVFRSFAPASLGSTSLGGTLSLDLPKWPEKTKRSSVFRSALASEMTSDEHEFTRSFDMWSALGSFGEVRFRAGFYLREVNFHVHPKPSTPDLDSVDRRDSGDSEDSEENTKTRTKEWLVSFSGNRATGNYEYLDPVASNLSKKEDVYVNREHAQTADISSLIAYKMDLPWRGAFGKQTTFHLFQLKKMELPGTARSPSLSPILRSFRQLIGTEFTRETQHHKSSLKWFMRHDHMHFTSSEMEAKTSLSPTLSEDRVFGIGLGFGHKMEGTMKDGELKLEAQSDVSIESYLPGDWQGQKRPYGATRVQGGIGIDAFYTYKKTFTLSASGRMDLLHNQRKDVDEQSREGAEAEDALTLRPTGFIGAEYKIVDKKTIKWRTVAHGGYLSRSPSFLELYGNRGAFLGNPNLRAEKAFAADLGLLIDLYGEQKQNDTPKNDLSPKEAPLSSAPLPGVGEKEDEKKKESWLNKRLKMHLEIMAFFSSSRDLIAYVPEGAYARARATNLERALKWGLELKWVLDWSLFYLQASYTMLNTYDLGLCRSDHIGADCTHPPLPGRPGHELSADLSVHFYDFGLPLSARYGIDFIGDMRADRLGDIYVPSRFTHLLGLRWNLTDVGIFSSLTLGLELRNLLDAKVGTYEGALGPLRLPLGDQYDYPLPGRSVFFSLQLKQKSSSFSR